MSGLFSQRPLARASLVDRTQHHILAILPTTRPTFQAHRIFTLCPQIKPTTDYHPSAMCLVPDSPITRMLRATIRAKEARGSPRRRDTLHLRLAKHPAANENTSRQRRRSRSFQEADLNCCPDWSTTADTSLRLLHPRLPAAVLLTSAEAPANAVLEQSMKREPRHLLVTAQARQNAVRLEPVATAQKLNAKRKKSSFGYVNERGTCFIRRTSTWAATFFSYTNDSVFAATCV
jgi:hypothetical protein